MTRYLTTLADVDGTVPGRAALVTIRLDPDNPEQMHTIFVEGDGCIDPCESAEALWQSIEDDWPEHQHTVIHNQRARFLKWQRTMTFLLGGSRDNHTPAAFLEAI